MNVNFRHNYSQDYIIQAANQQTATCSSLSNRLSAFCLFCIGIPTGPKKTNTAINEDFLSSSFFLPVIGTGGILLSRCESEASILFLSSDWCRPKGSKNAFADEFR